MSLTDQPTEILHIIIGMMNVQTIGRLSQTSRKFCELTARHIGCMPDWDVARRKRIAKLRHHNPLLTLLKRTDHKSWIWWRLSYNSNITIDIVLENPDWPWEYQTLIKNPNITLEIMRLTPTVKWPWRCISNNPNITPDVIMANPDINWDWRSLSTNRHITIELILLKSSSVWDWSQLSANPAITPAIVENYMVKDVKQIMLQNIASEISD